MTVHRKQLDEVAQSCQRPPSKHVRSAGWRVFVGSLWCRSRCTPATRGERFADKCRECRLGPRSSSGARRSLDSCPPLDLAVRARLRSRCRPWPVRPSPDGERMGDGGGFRWGRSWWHSGHHGRPSPLAPEAALTWPVWIWRRATPLKYVQRRYERVKPGAHATLPAAWSSHACRGRAPLAGDCAESTSTYPRDRRMAPSEAVVHQADRA